MTSPAIGSRSPTPSNSSSSLDLYLFDCGHGDTILIRLPGDRWVMVDCYLPKQGGVRDRFFAFVQQHAIQTLDVVFQTHPDRDHFHGMQAVLEHFIDNGQTIEAYLDCGLTAKRASYLVRPGPTNKEYQRLHDQLRAWQTAGKIKRWHALTAGHHNIYAKNTDRSVGFAPIGPDPSNVQRIAEQDLQKLAAKISHRPNANSLSLILTLFAVVDGKQFIALLPGDTDVECIKQSIEYWDSKSPDFKLSPNFDVIKVPHHGSKHSHHKPICKLKHADGFCVAGVTAGTRPVLPDRVVLMDYLSAGWQTMSTTTRSTPLTASNPMTLADRTQRVRVGSPESHLVHLSWSPVDGLSSGPKAAIIQLHDLQCYGTAKS